MLALPAPVEQSIRQATQRPVVYAELVTGLLDNPQILKSDWDASLAQLATQVVSEHSQTSDPPAMVQLAYPDPTRVEDGFKIYATQNLRTVRVSTGRGSGRTFEFDQTVGFPYQTIRISAGEQSGYDVPTIYLRLQRVGGTNTFPLRLDVYEFVTSDGDVAGDIGAYNSVNIFPSAEIQSSAIPTSMGDVAFTFSPPLVLRRGRQYALLLRPRDQSVTNSHLIDWEGYSGLGMVPYEQAGFGTFNIHQLGTLGGLAGEEGLELSVRIPVKTYVWDGTNTAYRDIKIDLGSTPTEAGYFDFAYRTPADTRVRFRAWSSATGAFAGEETQLGAADGHTQADDGHDGSVAHVHDGDVITDLKRYYKIRVEPLGTSTPANVTQSLLHTPSIHGVNVIFPSKKVRFCGGHTPILDALPAIKSIPTITSRIDLKGYSVPSQTLALELSDLGGYVFDVPTEVNLKNSLIEIRFGMLNGTAITSKDQLAPYFFGKVSDYSVQDGMLTLHCKPLTDDLALKIPPVDRRDPNTSLIPIDFSAGTHIIDALDRLIFTEGRTPRRYKHAQSFKDAKTYLANWLVKRRLSEQRDVREYVNELLEVIGHFLVTDEDGKLRLIRYPRSGNAVVTWGNDDLIPGTMQEPSFESSIINLCMALWGHPQPDGSDFSPEIRADFDAVSADAWAPGSQSVIFDRLIKGYWLPGKNPLSPTGGLGGDVMASQIVKRVVKHAANGIIRIRCQTTLRHYGVQVGDFIDLQTPVFVRKGYKGSIRPAQKFMAASKTVDLERGIISWELLEARDSNRPPLPAMSVTPLVGTAPFTINFDATGTTDPDSVGIAKYEWDIDYDGVNFQADYIGISGSHQYASGTAGRKVVALRVTDTDGATAIRTVIVRARVAPTAQISVVFQSSAVNSLNAVLSGIGSTSRSSEIVGYEWDLSYDAGQGFQVESTQPTVIVGVPLNSLTVALRVTDADGLVSTVVTMTLNGDTIGPAAPTAFSVVGVYRAIRLRWTNPTDGDFGWVNVYRSATNDSSTATKIASISGSGWEDTNVNVGQIYYYWLKASDVSKNESAFSQGQFAGVAGTAQAVGSTEGSTEVADNTITNPKVVDDTITPQKIKIGTRGISISGLEISAQTPTANTLYWTAGVIEYINDSGGTTAASITGSNALWSTGTLYLYWVKGASALSTTTDLATALGVNNVVLATYKGGTDLVINYGRPIVDGSDIVAGTITALGTVTTGILQNAAGTLVLNLNTGLFSVNLAGGLRVQAADGLRILNGGDLRVQSGGSLYLEAGGDLYLTDDATNPSEIRFRQGSDTSKYWRLAKDTTNDRLMLRWVGASNSGQLQFGSIASGEHPIADVSFCLSTTSFGGSDGIFLIVRKTGEGTSLGMFQVDAGASDSGGPDLRCGRVGAKFYLPYRSSAPESAVSADPGTLMFANDATIGLSPYFKESGSGNTGWRRMVISGQMREADLDWANADGLSQWTLVDAEVSQAFGGTPAWTTVRSYKVYLSDRENALEYIAQLRTDNGAQAAHVRLVVGANNGTDLSTTSTTYVFTSAGSVTVAGSGWVTVDVQLNGQSNTSYLRSLTVRVK